MESQHHAHAEPFYPDSQGNVATITCHVRNDANDHLISGLVIRLCNRIQGADIVAASQGCDRTNTKEVYAAPDDPHGANAIIEYRPTHIKTGRPISVMLAGQYHIGTCELIIEAWQTREYILNNLQARKRALLEEPGLATTTSTGSVISHATSASTRHISE